MEDGIRRGVLNYGLCLFFTIKCGLRLKLCTWNFLGVFSTGCVRSLKMGEEDVRC